MVKCSKYTLRRSQLGLSWGIEACSEWEPHNTLIMIWLIKEMETCNGFRHKKKKRINKVYHLKWMGVICKLVVTFIIFYQINKHDMIEFFMIMCTYECIINDLKFH